MRNAFKQTLLPHKTNFKMVSYVKSIAHMRAHNLQTAQKEGNKINEKHIRC